MSTEPNRHIDQRCFDLAEFFLRPVKGATGMDMQELAEAIQDLCEEVCGELAAEEAGEDEL